MAVAKPAPASLTMISVEGCCVSDVMLYERMLRDATEATEVNETFQAHIQQGRHLVKMNVAYLIRLFYPVH